MASFEETRKELGALRQRRDHLEEDIRSLREKARRAETDVAALSRTLGKQHPDLLKARADQKRLAGEIAEKQKELRQAKAQAQQKQGDLTQETPMEQVDLLSDSTPFLFFPVRIETRFMTVDGGDGRTCKELWVRIYPDDILIDTHEPQLTETEVSAARDYWTEVWKAGPDAGGRLGAWRALVDSAGANRAAWVVKAYYPANRDDLLNTAAAEDPALDPSGNWPDYEAKSESWSRSPRAPLMPDRFVVTAYSGGEKVIEAVGNPIPDPLVVGLDPNPVDEDGAVEVVGDEIRVPADMRWMVDFKAAVSMGMGLKIPLTDVQARAGFDRLLVLGLRLTSDAGEGKAGVEALIDAHQYSPGGFSLVPVGTATNNTESAQSGYSSFDVGAETSYALMSEEQFQESRAWTEKTDGQRLSEWLGIDGEVLKHVQHSGGLDGRDARGMNTALWPATLGYFLEEMMDPVFSAGERAAVREFFLQYVTGRGPVSSIRVGKQPYGILPATVWSRLTFPAQIAQEEAPLEMNLKGILDRMSGDWDKMAEQVSYAGKDGDPYQILLDMLGLHASSAEFYQRIAAGPDYLTNYLNLQRLNPFALRLMEYWITRGQEVLTELGYDPAQIPAVFEKTFFARSTLLDGPVVDDVPLSETDPIRAYSEAGENYIGWLLKSEINTIRRQDFGAGKEAPAALLYLMLRHAVMLSYWDGAMRLHGAAGNLQAGDRKEIELLHISTTTETYSKWDYLYTPSEAITGDAATTVGVYLDGFKAGAAARAPLADLAEFQAVNSALDLLKDLPTACLERVFTEHLDLCSYRLDAWKQGLIHKKLESLRYTRAPGENEEAWQTGLYLGAFGWLEDLRPSDKVLEEVPESELPEAFVKPDLAPIRRDSESAGYIHGPSLTHAITAAVLRNAYLTHADSSSADVMSVNLSSERVRATLSLIQGVRQGQGLAELLGYKFERGLHDRHEMAEVDKFIYPLRKAFPLYADELTESGSDTSITAVEARNVMNGVSLLDHIQESGNKTYPFGLSTLPEATADEAAAINAEVDRLADALDAVGDLGTAEGVYQVVQGNYDRAGAAMKALTEGGVPPIPEIVQTPRSGFTLTHRGIALFDSSVDLSDPAAYNPGHAYGITFSPRAAAEPGLNRWLATILPEPDHILVLVTWTEESTGSERSRTVSIVDLDLQPIDLVYILGRRQENEWTEVDARINYFVRGAEGLDAGVQIQIKYQERDPGWGAVEVTLFELPPLIEALRTMITGCRPLSGMDLILPSEDTSENEYSSGFDYDEIAARAAAAQTSLSALKDTLQGAHDALEAGSDEDETLFDNLRAALFPLAAYGVLKAVPGSATGASSDLKAFLLEQAQTVLNEAVSKHDAYDQALASVTADMTADQKVRKQIEAGSALLGSDFKMLPVFAPNNPDELEQSFGASEGLLSYTSSSLPVEQWLNGVARVRPGMALWEQAALMSDNFERAALELEPVQLPHLESDPWLAIDYPSDYTISGDKLLLAVHQGAAFDKSRPQKGLVLDEWVETVPGTEETTGITFHYDAPNSEPPQTLLLAVPPEVTGKWEWQDLIDTLNETLDMAKQRAVEPEHIDDSDYAQMLPAILMAFAASAITVSTNLAAQAGLGKVSIGKVGS